MQHLYDRFESQQQWFSENIRKAESKDIELSDKLHCGSPMEHYIGSQFVDWTHRCTKCGVMYGCA